jgi:phosphate/sulfate permease
MAPRASWLLGILVGLVAAACYSFLMLSGALGVTAGPQNENLAREFVAASFFLSPVVGAFFAATAAWYRRFLQLSNPNRGRGRGAAPPRPDGRTRAARPGQQKAVPRR